MSEIPRISLEEAERSSALLAANTLMHALGWREGGLYAMACEIVEQRDALKAELAVLRADRDSWEEQASDRLKDWDEMRQQCEALRADAERYRWLRERINWEDRIIEHPGFAPRCDRFWVHYDTREIRPDSEHIDDYIDAARGDT